MLTPALRHHKAFLAWLCALLMAWGALAPAVTQWLIARDATPTWMTELCSISNVGVSTDARSTAPKPEQGTLHDGAHCPACLIQAHAPGLPPTSGMSLPLVSALSQAVPSLFLHAPTRRLHAWSPLSARAPPLSA